MKYNKILLLILAVILTHGLQGAGGDAGHGAFFAAPNAAALAALQAGADRPASPALPNFGVSYVPNPGEVVVFQHQANDGISYPGMCYNLPGVNRRKMTWTSAGLAGFSIACALDAVMCHKPWSAMWAVLAGFGAHRCREKVKVAPQICSGQLYKPHRQYVMESCLERLAQHPSYRRTINAASLQELTAGQRD